MTRVYRAAHRESWCCSATELSCRSWSCTTRRCPGCGVPRRVAGRRSACGSVCVRVCLVALRLFICRTILVVVRFYRLHSARGHRKSASSQHQASSQNSNAGFGVPRAAAARAYGMVANDTLDRGSARVASLPPPAPNSFAARRPRPPLASARAAARRGSRRERRPRCCAGRRGCRRRGWRSRPRAPGGEAEER